MGTRGLVGIRKNKKDKCIYNHFDSYPSCLGEKMVEYIKVHTDYAIDKLYERLKKVEDYNTKLIDLNDYEQSCFDKCIRNLFPNINRDNIKIVDLLRPFEGCLEMYDEYPEVNFFEEYNNFIKDSLSCEWAYIINLDTKKLEIYIGFQREPQKDNRYGITANDGYYPCKLISEIPLTSIRRKNFNLIKKLKKEYN